MVKDVRTVVVHDGGEETAADEGCSVSDDGGRHDVSTLGD